MDAPTRPAGSGGSGGGVVATYVSRETEPGRDCMIQHDPPPGGLCNDQPCSDWIASISQPKTCDGEHAHSSHYWWEGESIWSCAGRTTCESRFFPDAAGVEAA